jgi:hypothetical protein
MTGNPHFPDDANSRSARILGGLVQPVPDQPVADNTIAIGRPGRQLCFYPARQGYELQTELDFLSNRAMEPNIFFTGRFLAPAMPRLEDRIIRLALIRDTDARRSRIRFLMPFSVEKPGFSIGASIIRAWSNPFGPLGVPLLDAEDAAETIDNLYEALTCPDGQPARCPRASRYSPQGQVRPAGPRRRHWPQPAADGHRYLQPANAGKPAGRQTYLRHAISAGHLRELRRQWKLLEQGRPRLLQRRPSTGRYPRSDGGISGAGSEWLERPGLHGHGARPLPRRLCTRSDHQPCRSRQRAHSHARSRRHGDRFDDRLHDGGRGLYLENGL